MPEHRRKLLQEAFSVAHFMGESQIPERYRKKFRRIAELIWKAHGEQGAPPAELSAELPAAPGELLPALQFHPVAFAMIWPGLGGDGLLKVALKPEDAEQLLDKLEGPGDPAP